MRLAVIACCIPVLAFAEPAPAPRFEVIDRGSAVEVIARNVKAATTAITPVRSRLEVPVLEQPQAAPVRPTDRTVKSAELAGSTRRVLSVKLRFERADVKLLARYAQALQVGDDLHLILPRTIPDGITPIDLPEPTLSPAMAAKLAAIPEPAIEHPAAPGEQTIGPALAAAGDAKPAQRVPAPVGGVANGGAGAKPNPAPAPATESSDVIGRLSTYGAVLLLLAGVALWIVRRRRANQLPASSIDLIAQRSLGTKAKIVWLAAGTREMVVAVTPQQVRMLDQWQKTDEARSRRSPLPEAHTVSERDDRGAPSPAVAGILRLRAKTAQIQVPVVSEHVATGDEDADAEWAKEILTATRRARRGALGTAVEEQP